MNSTRRLQALSSGLQVSSWGATHRPRRRVGAYVAHSGADIDDIFEECACAVMLSGHRQPHTGRRPFDGPQLRSVDNDASCATWRAEHVLITPKICRRGAYVTATAVTVTVVPNRLAGLDVGQVRMPKQSATPR